MKKLNGMGFKRENLLILFLVLTLACTMLLFAFMCFRPGKTFTAINLGILVGVEVYFLIHRFNKTNRQLSRFFEYFHAGEGMMSFQTHNNGLIKSLQDHLNRIMSEFHTLRKNTEQERLFYLNALHHTQTGLLIVDEKGNIRFCNRVVQKMLPAGNPHHVRKLEILCPRLPHLILTVAPSRTELIRAVVNEELVMLSLRCNIFNMNNETLRIISLQDIKVEMEYNEAEAWQKLIRILTHEIMNSVSPITLTAAGIIQMLHNTDHHTTLSLSDRQDMINGMEAIRKRSRGLSAFVEGYQRINQLPQPVLVQFAVKPFFSQMEILLRADLNHLGIDYSFEIIPETLMLYADEKLISQVLINLIRNSMAALENRESRIIEIKAFQVNSHVRITVYDNGKGIDPSLLDTIFVPFFTTRKDGSGIGLSVSREIMKLHGGGLRVHSHYGVDTTFTLLF